MKNSVLYIVIAALALVLILGYFAYKGGKFGASRTDTANTANEEQTIQEENVQEDDSIMEEEEKMQDDDSVEEEESTPGGTMEDETQAPTL